MTDDKTFLQRVKEREETRREARAPRSSGRVSGSLPEANVTGPSRIPVRNVENPPPPRGGWYTHSIPDSEQYRRTRYAEQALQNEATNLANTPANTRRNTALNNARFSLHRFIVDGILDAEYVDDTLFSAAKACGLPDDEILATLNSATQGGASKPITRPAVPPSRPQIEVRPWTAPIDTSIPQPEQMCTPIYTHPVWGSHNPTPAANYLFDHEDTQTALWGHDQHILWSEGEALMIAGGMGLGKTTLAGQLIRAQLGLTNEVLGLPVETVDKPILYLAMDRPRQIRRSMLRQYDHTERHQLQNLLIRPGPPIADIAVRPTLLAEMAAEAGAGTIYIDSLKDAAIGLSSDEVGAAYNRARQYALAQGCQLCELHHLIKRNPMGGAPSSVADVYGSNWLTAGAGSIIMLTGDPGDPIIEFRHAKQPVDEVGPYRLLHDQHHGLFTIDHEVDLVSMAGASGAQGLTPLGAAMAIFEREKPTRSQVEKARRRLDKLVSCGKLVKVEGMKGGVSGGLSANYFKAG